MRLIDADDFKRQIVGMAIVTGYSAKKANKMCELIDEQPTAYDVDKVLKQLEDEQFAEWLEELKAMRNLYKTNFSDGYNRGIDDFLKEADATFPMQNDGTAVLRRLEKIADRLKGGGSCE